jgi:hypothetical protein
MQVRVRLAFVSCVAFAVVIAGASRAGAGEPSDVAPHEHPSEAPNRFLATPLFVSFGLLTTFANPNARGTGGLELSVVHWFEDTLGSPGVGAYMQGEYVGGGTARGSIGLEGNFAALGIEAGYAYDHAFEGARHVHALQVTPFVSNGVLYFGVRTLTRFSGDPIAAMAVFGVKVPINVGGKMADGGNPPAHLYPH